MTGPYDIFKLQKDRKRKGNPKKLWVRKATGTIYRIAELPKSERKNRDR